MALGLTQLSYAGDLSRAAATSCSRRRTTTATSLAGAFERWPLHWAADNSAAA
jgi:hypothetical protein